MTLSIIVAIAKNRIIGKDGQLPWHYSEDLKHFRRVTTGHPIIMGRRTWESIGRPLPKRRNIVVSRTLTCAPDGVELASSLTQALSLTGADDEAFVIGGARLYEEALNDADRIYLTEIDDEVAGDVSFPRLPEDVFEVVEQRAGETPKLSFLVLQRKH